MKLPGTKNRGDNITHGEWNDLMAHAKSNAVVNSPDIVAQHGPGGTSLFLSKRSSNTSLLSNLAQFEIYQAPSDPLYDAPEDWRTFKVHTGRVSCKTPDNDDAGEEPLVVIIPASTAKYYFWLDCQVKISTNSGELLNLVVEEVTIKHGTDPATEGWTDFPDQTPGENSNTITFRQVIGTVQTGSETATADDFHQVTIDQNVRSHLTVGLPIDHVSLQGTYLKLWRKMMFFGPDNFVECPSEVDLSTASSSGQSSPQQSSPNESQPPQSQSSDSASWRSSYSESWEDSFSYSSGDSIWENSFPPWSSAKTAIVPYRPKKGAEQFVGLFCSEMPDARFEDIVIITLGRHRSARRKLNPIFLKVCEPKSIIVSSAVPSHPVLIGARIERGQIVVECATRPHCKLVITLRVTGIRRGFAGRRFQRFTREQMRANDRFYASAHRKQEPPSVKTILIRGRKHGRD